MEQYNANRATISFHLTQEEKEKIVERAEQNGLTITDYLKDIVFNTEHYSELNEILDKYEIDDLEEVLEEWNMLMDDETVCKTFEKFAGKEITIPTEDGEETHYIESKIDIILLRLWMKP